MLESKRKKLKSSEYDSISGDESINIEEIKESKQDIKEALKDYITAPNNIPKKYRVFDLLARLIEPTEEGCTAVSIFDGKLLIASNSLAYAKMTGRKNQYINIVSRLMIYFNKVALQEEYPRDDRIKLFIDLAVEHVQGQIQTGNKKQGKVEDIKKIINSIIDEKYELDRNFMAQHRELFRAQDIIKTLYNDFRKMEKYIEKNTDKEDEPMINALKNVRKPNVIGIKSIITKDNLHKYASKGQPIILRIGIGNVHAERRILDFLLMAKFWEKQDPIYIGISKTCCFHCALSIKAINVLAEQYPDANPSYSLIDQQDFKFIFYRGFHGLVLGADSNMPLFLSVNQGSNELHDKIIEHYNKLISSTKAVDSAYLDSISRSGSSESSASEYIMQEITLEDMVKGILGNGKKVKKLIGVDKGTQLEALLYELRNQLIDKEELLEFESISNEEKNWVEKLDGETKYQRGK